MLKPFTIKSIENRSYSKKHKCIPHQVVNSNKLLVMLEPPIPSHVYDKDEDIDLLVLAPKFKDTVLIPEVSEWPMNVYMLIPKEGGNWESGPYNCEDWGLLEDILS